MSDIWILLLYFYGSTDGIYSAWNIQKRKKRDVSTKVILLPYI